MDITFIHGTNEESYEQLDTISEEYVPEITQNVGNDAEEIIVHIAGEVNKPGIVRTKEGARIADVIESAGGLTELADITNINLAYIIEDGQKITIPLKNENIKQTITSENGQGIIQENTLEQGQGITKVNINKATIQELQTLPGVGKSTAEKIIEYRNQTGEFKKIEDIKNVSGIGDSKYEAIKDYIKVK